MTATILGMASPALMAMQPVVRSEALIGDSAFLSNASASLSEPQMQAGQSVGKEGYLPISEAREVGFQNFSINAGEVKVVGYLRYVREAPAEAPPSKIVKTIMEAPGQNAGLVTLINWARGLGELRPAARLAKISAVVPRYLHLSHIDSGALQELDAMRSMDAKWASGESYAIIFSILANEAGVYSENIGADVEREAPDLVSAGLGLYNPETGQNDRRTLVMGKRDNPEIHHLIESYLPDEGRWVLTHPESGLSGIYEGHDALIRQIYDGAIRACVDNYVRAEEVCLQKNILEVGGDLDLYRSPGQTEVLRPVTVKIGGEVDSETAELLKKVDLAGLEIPVPEQAIVPYEEAFDGAMTLFVLPPEPELARSRSWRWFRWEPVQ